MKSNIAAQHRLKWKLESKNPQVHKLTFTGIKAGWEGAALLMSDEHFDNKHTDLALLRRHHEEAKEINAPIFKFGDIFCAMQGKWDKRADQTHLRDEHRGNNYLDRLVSDAAKFYAPFSKQIALMTGGNHEGSIMQRHQTSLLDRLKERLEFPALGSYEGFVQFAFMREGYTRPDFSKVLRWHHGYGGGGEVTRGLIDHSRTSRQALADIYYSGHIHRQNCDRNIIQLLNHQGNIDEIDQWFLRGSSYKDEHSDGNGWHVATGKGPRPKGGWWLKFKYNGSEIRVTPVPAL